ncbi:MAG: TetR/AcrR family transcriptional regulator [Actinomycetota bacterium]|nr:TetR/AcrR family transcriptional regulator [Actinomycetota bacterium]
MSSSSALDTADPRRRDLGSRQADRVDALVAATVEELRANGYDGLTVRNAARRAGVAPATAYTYFGSKDHLVAEVFMRRLDGWAAPSLGTDASAADRVVTVLRDLAVLVAAEPELAAASTTAILAGDPDVQRLRDRIGAAFNDRLRAALGDGADPAVLRALNLALAGALLQAGMGYFGYTELADRMTEVVGLLLGPS